MTYVKPECVISPVKRLKIFEILRDKKHGKCAYAMGEWDGKRCLLFRWNGTSEKPIGNPQSRGKPTWVVLDDELYEYAIQSLTASKRREIMAYLDGI